MTEIKMPVKIKQRAKKPVVQSNVADAAGSYSQPNIAFIRPELMILYGQYKTIRDSMSEQLVKGATTKYLPCPADAKGQPDLKRYEAYITRAVYYNVMARTVSGMVGQVFMREPVIKLPELLDSMIEDASGSGISLEHQLKKSLALTLAYSRSGVFVDYPSLEQGATIDQIQSGQIKPTITTYSPLEVINWRTTTTGSVTKLSLVVIFELYPFADDGFEMKQAGQFRRLYLDENDLYVSEIWRQPNPNTFDGMNIDEIGKSTYTPFESYMPTDGKGNRLDYIPFTFIGSENNDPNPDLPQMYALASLNLAHYRNSADYEESCYIVGQPTIVVNGLTPEWLEDQLGGIINFGSRGGIPLPTGADAKLIQAAPNTMIKEAMLDKERQMIALGAKLIESKTIQRTAFEAGLEAVNAGSVLSSTADNVSEAYELAAKWACNFVNVDFADSEIDLNTDLTIDNDPASRTELVNEWLKGAISWTEMRTGLRKAGIATQKDEEAKKEIKADSAEQAKIDQANAKAIADNMPPDNANNVGN